jgi:hypothetical protein
MIDLPDVNGLFGLAPVEKIVGGALGVDAVVGQCDQGGVKVLHDAIHPMIIGNGPSVAQRHVTHLSMDKGHSRGRFAQSEPLDHLCESGSQAVWMSSVTAPAPG